MAGAASAFLVLPMMCGESNHWVLAIAIVVGAAFIACFSFGSGLACRADIGWDGSRGDIRHVAG